MELKNENFKKVQVAADNCSPDTANTGAATILVNKKTGTFGHMSMILHDNHDLALPEDEDDTNYVSFSNQGNTVGAMVTGTKATYVGFGHDLRDVTDVFTLYNVNTAAMKAKWKDIK